MKIFVLNLKIARRNNEITVVLLKQASLNTGKEDRH